MTAIVRFICHNWPQKLTALGMGIILWVVLTMNTNPWMVKDLDVTVEGRGVPEGLQVMSITPTTVSVAVAGRKRRVERVTAAQLRATADLSRRDVGEHQVSVALDAASLPPGVSVHRPPARTVVVALDPTVEAKRPVDVVRRGEAQPGYRITNTDFRPNQVAVRGPQRLVQSVERVVAEVWVSGIRESRSYVCELEAHDTGGGLVEGLQLEPNEITVEFTVEQVNIATLVVTVGDALTIPSGYTLAGAQPNPPVVTVTGDRAALEGLKTVGIRDTQVQAGDSVVRAELDLPEGIISLDGDSIDIIVDLNAPQRRSRPPPSTPEPAPTPDPEPEEPDGEPGANNPPTEPQPTPEPGPEEPGSDGPATPADEDPAPDTPTG